MPSPPKSTSSKRGRPLKSRPRVSSDEESPPLLERQDIYPTPRMMSASRPKTENTSLTKTFKPETAPGTTKPSQSVKSEPNDEFYTVEQILRKRHIKRKVHYQVKWEGFSMEHCTWEPAANLKGCSQLIEEFEKRKSEDTLSKTKRPRAVNAKSESTTNTADSYDAGEYFESSENDSSESDPKDKDDDWVEWHVPASVKKTTSKSKSTSVAAKSRSKVLPKVEPPHDTNDREVMEPTDLHPEQDVDERDAMKVVFARPGQTGSGTDYLVKYNDLSYDWVPSAVAIGKYPQQIIRYFSELMQAGSFEFESIRCFASNLV